MKRGKIRNGQLAPLKARLTEAELDKRQYRIHYRRKVAIALGLTSSLRAVFARGFFGRLKFAFTGK